MEIATFSTRNFPKLVLTISYGLQEVNAYALLDCASKLTLLKPVKITGLQLNSNFDLELVNSICRRNQQLQHIHIATLLTKEIGMILGCDSAELVTSTKATPIKTEHTDWMENL